MRYEFAADEAFPRDAHALTAQARLAVETSLTKRIDALVEGEFVGAIVDDFNDASGGPPSSDEIGRPFVVDPNTAELNRFQLSAELAPNARATVGRQRLSIDEERFLGRVAFRQNEQTFDAVRFEAEPVAGAFVDVGYFRRVNRIFGGDSDAGAFRGDSYFVNAGATTPIGRFTFFRYAFDLELAPGEVNPTLEDLASSVTTGGRWNERWGWRDGHLALRAAYARQREFADAPIAYDANYWLGAAEARFGRLTGEFRYEILSAGGGRAFQAPLGTLHKFQGFADVFLVTPDVGIVDASIGARVRFGSAGPFRGVGAFARGHAFEAEDGGARLGREIDFGVSATVAGVKASLVAAFYDADAFGTDTERFWATLSRRF
ncbi:MAG: hypothetical protein ACFB00_02265 [Parvularculaceae bacterium]